MWLAATRWGVENPNIDFAATPQQRRALPHLTFDEFSFSAARYAAAASSFDPAAGSSRILTRCLRLHFQLLHAQLQITLLCSHC